VPHAYLIHYDPKGEELERLAISLPSLETEKDGLSLTYDQLRSSFISLYGANDFEYISYSIIEHDDVSIPEAGAYIPEAAGISQLSALNLVDLAASYPAESVERMESSRDTYIYDPVNDSWVFSTTTIMTGMSVDGYTFHEVFDNEGTILYWDVRDSKGRLIERYQKFIDGRPLELLLYAPSDMQYVIDLTGQEPGIDVKLTSEEQDLWNLPETLENVVRVIFYDISFSTPREDANSSIELPEKITGIIELDFTGAAPQASLINYDYKGEEVERVTLLLPLFGITGNEGYADLRAKFILLHQAGEFEYVDYTIMNKDSVWLPVSDEFVTLDSGYDHQGRKIGIERAREIYVYDADSDSWVLDVCIETTEIKGNGYTRQVVTDGVMYIDIRNEQGRLVQREQGFVDGEPTELAVFMPSLYDNQPWYEADLTGNKGVSIVIDGITINNVMHTYFYELPQINGGRYGFVSAELDLASIETEGDIAGLEINVRGPSGTVLSAYTYYVPVTELGTLNYEDLNNRIASFIESDTLGAVATLKEERHLAGVVNIDDISGLNNAQKAKLAEFYPGISRAVSYIVTDHETSSTSTEYYYGRFDLPVMRFMDNPDNTIANETIIVIHNIVGYGIGQEIEEALFYNKDTGRLLMSDVLTENVASDSETLQQKLKDLGVIFGDERQDDFKARFDEFIENLNVRYLQLYERTIYTYDRGGIYSENIVYLFYDESSHALPRLSAGPTYVEIIYPEGQYEEPGYEYPLDERYFPEDIPDYVEAPLVTLDASGQLIVDGQVYEIRGVTLSTVPEGEKLEALVLDLESLGEEQIQLMQDIGINTVRTYYPPTVDLLDAFARHDIRVIVGFPWRDIRINRGPDIISGTYQAYIEAYKNHPAILMWEFGNEYNYSPYTFAGDMSNWYNALESVAHRAKQIDGRHPVASTHGYYGDRSEDFSLAVASAPSVDIWGLNVYNWDDPTEVIENIRTSGIDVPLYISETGADSYNNYLQAVDEEMQADAVVAIYESIESTDVLGVTFMTWQDEWWKAGLKDMQNPAGRSFAVAYDGFGNEEYFGWVRIDGSEKPVIDAVRTLWGGKAVLPVIALDASAPRAPPMPEEYFAAHVSLPQEPSVYIFRYFKDPIPMPQFEPTLGDITTMQGVTAELDTIPIYDPQGLITGSTQIQIDPITHKGTISLPRLIEFANYTEYGQLTGFVYREPLDTFGRIVVQAIPDIARSELYIVLDFQESNIYQPGTALKLLWSDDIHPDIAGEQSAYIVVQAFEYDDNLVHVDAIYGFDTEQRQDILETIANIRRKDVADLTDADLMLVRAESAIDGQTFSEYAIPGDELGRTVIIDRAGYIFITQAFIGLTVIPQQGYFIDRNTGETVLEVLNTDDKDEEYGLGFDFDLDNYRVRYKNPNTEEIWYRWHYPQHIWGGWAYEERGYFEELDEPYTYIYDSGHEITTTHRWIPETRLYADEWSTTFDEALETRFCYIIDGQELFAYRTVNHEAQSAGEAITPSIESIYDRELGSDLWQDLQSFGITPDARLSQVELIPILWEGSTSTMIQAATIETEEEVSYIEGPSTFFWTLPSDPLGREFFIQNPTSETTYRYTLNLWWIDNDAPATVLPASLSIDGREIETRTFSETVSVLDWYDSVAGDITQMNISELSTQGFVLAYVYEADSSDHDNFLLQEVRLPSGRLIQGLYSYQKIRVLNSLPAIRGTEVVQYDMSLPYPEPQLAFELERGMWTKLWDDIIYSSEGIVHIVGEKEPLGPEIIHTHRYDYDTYGEFQDKARTDIGSSWKESIRSSWYIICVPVVILISVLIIGAILGFTRLLKTIISLGEDNSLASSIKYVKKIEEPSYKDYGFEPDVKKAAKYRFSSVLERLKRGESLG